MFNHNQQKKSMTYLYDNERNGFAVVAEKDVKAGEEIFISYHVMSNVGFFLSYGFI